MSTRPQGRSQCLVRPVRLRSPTRAAGPATTVVETSSCPSPACVASAAVAPRVTSPRRTRGPAQFKAGKDIRTGEKKKRGSPSSKPARTLTHSRS